MKKIIFVLMLMFCSLCFGEKRDFLKVPYKIYGNVFEEIEINYIMIEDHLYIWIRQYRRGGALLHSHHCPECLKKKENNKR